MSTACFSVLISALACMSRSTSFQSITFCPALAACVDLPDLAAICVLSLVATQMITAKADGRPCPKIHHSDLGYWNMHVGLWTLHGLFAARGLMSHTPLLRVILYQEWHVCFPLFFNLSIRTDRAHLACENSPPGPCLFLSRFQFKELECLEHQGPDLARQVLVHTVLGKVSGQYMFY